MEAITRGQLAAIGALMNKLAITTDQKRDMVSGFSGGRCTSSKDLHKVEGMYLIRHLKSLDPEEKKAETMRRKIISMAHELHWQIPGTTRIDMRRVDEWCLKFGYGKKKLNQYLYSELPKLLTQFELGPYRSFINR